MSLWLCKGGVWPPWLAHEQHSGSSYHSSNGSQLLIVFLLLMVDPLNVLTPLLGFMSDHSTQICLTRLLLLIDNGKERIPLGKCGTAPSPYPHSVCSWNFCWNFEMQFSVKAERMKRRLPKESIEQMITYRQFLFFKSEQWWNRWSPCFLENISCFNNLFEGLSPKLRLRLSWMAYFLFKLESVLSEALILSWSGTLCRNNFITSYALAGSNFCTIDLWGVSSRLPTTQTLIGYFQRWPLDLILFDSWKDWRPKIYPDYQSWMPMHLVIFLVAEDVSRRCIQTPQVIQETSHIPLSILKKQWGDPTWPTRGNVQPTSSFLYLQSAVVEFNYQKYGPFKIMVWNLLKLVFARFDDFLNHLCLFPDEAS